MYTLILIVFVEAMGGNVGFVSTTPFETRADYIAVGERELANPFNPTIRYECQPIGKGV